MKIFRKLVGLCALIGLMTLALFGGSALADERPDFRLGISPSQQALGEIKPGESYSGTFKIKNDGTESLEYKIGFAPYSVSDVSYEPDFSKESVYTEIKDWITTDREQGKLEPSEEIELGYVVSVPSDAHGGFQSGIISVTMVKPESSSDVTGVEAVQQLGFIIYGNVDGEIVKTGKVLENKVPSFLFNPPIYGSSLVENTGNVYTAAEYKLQVFPLFSDEEVYTNEEKPENNIVFPETKRYNEIKWDGAPQLGIFKVRQTVKIFDDETVTEKMVFLCPIWFLFVVILLVFLIIFWIVSRVIKRKREA